jgi:hypothetical protein
MEVFNLLESVRHYHPISGQEWDLIAQRHMAFHTDEGRNRDQLKKKFNKLAKMKMGTGDPNMPANVREAKEIRRLIIEKTEGVTGSEEEAFAADDIEEDLDFADVENENKIAEEAEEAGEQENNNMGIVGAGLHRDAVGAAHAGVNGVAAGAVNAAPVGMGDAGTPRQRVSTLSFKHFL